MANQPQCLDCSVLLPLCIFLGSLLTFGTGQIRYSVPEETDKGFFVGNISKDLGLEPWEVAGRGVRIVSRGKTQLFALNPRGGSLVTAGRIDREELCDTLLSCLLNLEILVEDTLKIYGVEVEIMDINDNAPSFREEEIEIKVSEHTSPGSRFPLPSARDPDVGMHSLQSYQLSPSSYFSLQVRGGTDGDKNPELVLEEGLDREKEASHHLLLTALDGGDPILKGTVPVRVVVLDVNDHIPKFTQSVYRVSIPENLSSGTRVLVVNATDPDEGINGEVTYSFGKMKSKVSETFQLNSRTGEVLVGKPLDFEKYRFYEMEIQGQDGGGLLSTTTLLITVEDVNDNTPEITVTSSINSVPENSPSGTVIALLNVQDQDSGENGQVSCFIPNGLPFKLEKTYGNYYKLITNRELDREQVESYNITLTAKDQGSPSLSTETHILLKVADANDNPPVFTHSSYSAYIPENNPRGSSIFSVTAVDRDSRENAQVTYSLAEDTIQGTPLSSYVSVNSDTGVLYALQSFDYEQFQTLQLRVTASDNGDPPLRSNISLTLFVLDQNDNTPEILYPSLPTDGSTGVELAPRSAEPGYLVTKVVAVDRDSGQNAWLSYRLLKASEPGLFSVGLHTGEVRTARAIMDKDALKQSLVVTVEDHGQPPLSATVRLTVAVADSIPDVLEDLVSMESPAIPDESGLTLYLVVAITAVSCIFLIFVMVLLALRLRRWHSSRLLQAASGLAGVPPSHFVGIDGVRAFLQTYSHEVSLTADSRKSHLIFPQPNYADTLISQESCGKSEPLLIAEDPATVLGKCDPTDIQGGKGSEAVLDLQAPKAQCRQTETKHLSKETGRRSWFHFLTVGFQSLKKRILVQVVKGRIGNNPQVTMIPAQRLKDCEGLVFLGVLLGMLWEVGSTQIRYSVPEELENGSRVGNISKDLGLEPRELAERGVRIVSRGRAQLFALNPRSGSLVTAGRIDREELCMGSVKCQLNLEILMENIGKIYGVEVEVRDINDNAPYFRESELEIKMSENAATGMRFPLPHAWDPDIGKNSLQTYQLSPNAHFSLEVQNGADGNKYPELVLERAVDREEKALHLLVLTASDAGDPVRSGTARIRVMVVDANDNAPVFARSEYRVSVPENVAVGAQLLQVNATDPDEGANAEVTYSFRYVDDKAAKVFKLDSNLGTVSTIGELDHEESGFYEMEVQATDNAGYSARAKVLVTVLDVNDNAPEVAITSLTNSVPENSPRGTLIALLNVNDQDSGENGRVICSIQENLPFKLEKSYGNYYSLVTDTVLDREQVPSYNITVTATDRGSPPLSSETHLSLNIADTNDNPPVFPRASYWAYIPENNPRGASIASVTAHDPDSDKNAQVTYSLAEDIHQGVPLSSYVSINSDTGVLYALHSFDYEQFRDLQLQVMARDSGDPPLSSNVSLSLFILDQNDNAPEILYPALPTDGSTGVELAPRSAEPGYLVTKVVAVDRDSGQNGWLSYRLLKASEPGLFSVGLHTGEVSTARALMDRDALKQNLVVAVQDHGQPPLSATVTLTVAIADSIPDVLADLDSQESPSTSETSGLTLYLVVAVAAVSSVFLVFVLVLLAFRLRRWHSLRLLQAAGPGLADVPASHFVGVDGVQAFLQSYSHEVSLTAGSRKSHLIFPQPNYADTLISQESCEKSEPLLLSGDSVFSKDNHALIQVSPF